MQALTERQRMVLDFIGNSISEQGYPPTIREIGRFMGIRSTNGVNDHLKALERKGYLQRNELKSRAIVPTNILPLRKKMGSELVDVPLVGKVAAGLPILAQENIESTVTVDRFFLGTNKDVFALRVTGESMIEDGIFDGDFIFVKSQNHAEPGQVVVALIGDEATVKRFYPEGERIRFQPANRNMAPIIVERRDFKPTAIIGVVCGVYRQI